MNPKGLARAAIPGVAALILILCSAVCLLAALPAAPAGISSAAGSSGWKIYRNNRFGFQFRYPPDSSVSEEGPYTTQSGTQPDNLGTVRILGKAVSVEIIVFSLGIVHGDYDWPERPCDEWTFGPDNGPLSSQRIRFAGQNTLHVVARNFRGGGSPETDSYYCVNHPQNPVVIVFRQPASSEIQRILASFHFSKTSR